MGTFLHPIGLLSANGDHVETIDAPVDTGSTFSAMPSTILDRLGVESHRSVSLKLADGRVGERRIGRVLAEIDGVREEILCVFADAGDLPTIGDHTLEAFLLAVDIPAEALWA